MDFHDPNELLARLESVAVRTDNGSFVRVEDVRKLMQERSDTQAIQTAHQPTPAPKTVEQARAAVRKDPEIMKVFQHPPQEPGRSIPATEPQPLSRA